MEYEFILTTWSRDGAQTQVLEPLRLQWGGGWRDCARTLTFSALPEDLCPLGGAVELTGDGQPLFTGMISDRRRDSLGHTIDCTAIDRGIYLKNNYTCRCPRGETPEAAAAALCRAYGIPAGQLAATGIPISRNIYAASLYSIIQTMYTLASEQNGKKYQMRFRGKTLEIVEKALGPESIRLTTGDNILSCASGDSIRKLVTAVGIYAKDGSLSTTIQGDPELRKLYGRMERAIRDTGSGDARKRARAMLDEGGVETTISAHCLGNPKLITGTAVAVHEPVTGLDGLFWIQSDKHRVHRGIYTTDLELDFRNLMDKQQAGSLPKK